MFAVLSKMRRRGSLLVFALAFAGSVATPAFAGEAAPGSSVPAAPSAIRVLEVPGDGLYRVPPIAFKLQMPEPVATPTVTLWDLTGGYELPLTGAGVKVDGQIATVYVPEVEAGTYELRWDVAGVTGTHPFRVDMTSQSTNGEMTVRPAEIGSPASKTEQGPLWYVAAAGVMLGLFVAVLLRRKPAAALMSFVLVTSLGVVGSVASAPEPGDGSTVSLAQCRSYPMASQERFTCLRDYVYTSAPTLTGMMDLLDSLRNDITVVGDSENHTCHNVGHLLGRKLVEEGTPIGEVVATDRGWCDFGLMHGALENGARQVTDEEWRAVLVDVCATFTGQAMLQCAHGAGHGTSLRTNSDLSASLEMCASMKGTDLDKVLWQCATGSFMGYSNRVVAAFRYETLDMAKSWIPEPKEMYVPALCPELSGPVREACWLAGFRFLGFPEHGVFSADSRFTSITTNLDFCRQHEDAGLCVEGMLVRATDVDSIHDVTSVAQDCSTYDQEIWASCVRGLVHANVARFMESTAENRYELAGEICTTIEAVKPNSTALCREQLKLLGGDL